MICVPPKLEKLWSMYFIWSVPILLEKEGYGCRCTDAWKYFWTGIADPGHFWSHLWNNRHSDIILETPRLHRTYLSKCPQSRALDQVMQNSCQIEPWAFAMKEALLFPWAASFSVLSSATIGFQNMVSFHQGCGFCSFLLLAAFCLPSWTAESQLLGVVPCFWVLLHWEWAPLLSGKGSFPRTLWLWPFMIGRIGFFLALLHGRYCGNCSLQSWCRVFSVFVLLHGMEILQH